MAKKNSETNEQAKFLFSGVQIFLKNPDLSQMTIQNDCYAISVKRSAPVNTVTHAIGFTVDFEENDSTDENEEDGE